MALQVGSNLSAETIANEASIRLYDSFPFSSVTHAVGTRNFVQPVFNSVATGTIAVVAESAAQPTENTYQPTLIQKTGTLETYRASVLVSNELMADSAILKAIAQRLSGQIAEKAGSIVISNIAASLVSANRFDVADEFQAAGDMSSTTPTHAGFACMSNLSNIYRDRATWVFSKTGYRSWGDMEGRASLVTLPISNRKIGSLGKGGSGGGKGKPATSESGLFAPNDGQGTPAAGFGANAEFLLGGYEPNDLEGPPLQLSYDPRTSFRNARNPLEYNMTEQHDWTTAWLGSPVNISEGLGVMSAVNAVWMMLVDLGAYLHFHQPLTITLDTESKASNNQTVIHASYRCSGSLLEPTAGYAIRHGTT